MALYLGNYKVQAINIDNQAYKINTPFKHSDSNNIRLISLEGYTLQDINGLYLIGKEDK